jgi:hypothetical protein
MMRSFLIAVLAIIGLAASAPAQSSSAVPSIEVTASGGGTGNGDGIATVSGTINLPPGWELSIHVVTIRYQKDGSSKSLNVFISAKGANFSATINLPKGGYGIVGLIDVKDKDGHERQISSGSQNVNVP